MVETSNDCSVCGAYSVPKSANFCPNCGAQVNDSSSVVAGKNYNDYYVIPTAPAELVKNEMQSENDTMSGSIFGSGGKGQCDHDKNDEKDNSVTDNATFWKNPTPDMLKHTALCQCIGSILFVQTSGGMSGRFTLPRTIHCGQILAGSKIDLSYADFVYPVTTINVGTILGGVHITVPRGVRVKTTGFGILGGFKGLPSQTVNAGEVDDTPLVIIRGLTILGGATVCINRGAPPLKTIPV